MAVDEDTRTGNCRVDLTLGLHLDGDDTRIDVGAVERAVEELLEGATVYVGPRRSAFVIDHVDDPIHTNIVKYGK